MSTVDTNAPKGGRFVAWSGFLFGSVLSIGGNILFTWMPHPPEGALDTWAPRADWAPSPWAQIGAAAWSVALLISVEVMSRVRWPNRWTWNLARYGGISLVALGSAVISYGHLNHVLTEWDYGFGAYVGPLVIDGLMTLCGFAILADGLEPARGSMVETKSSIDDLKTISPGPAEAAKPRSRRTPKAPAAKVAPAPVVDEPAPATTSNTPIGGLLPEPQPAELAATQPQVDDDEIRDLIANGIGRRALATKLNITPHKARVLLEQRSVNGHQVVPS